ncbi:hypothetical protein AAFF_G00337740 [Aldrovandia affinis]|uniref:Uncharacterized protein n=1 Tax=Aldrovandia affinis TaxID=143900 RepID=A0AAD7SKV4_9TELE|nr:hypothetical protein AAFF_G00337740 [Aldrovandia affinis]
MNNIRPPDELKLSGNVHENWKAFKQSFELYVLAIGLDEREEHRRIALLLTVAGRAAVDVFNTFEFPEGDSDSRVQAESESIEQFVTDLRLKSQSCNFGTLCDSLIRDQIVIGVLDKKVRMQLLKEPDLSLAKAIRICQASESAKMQLKSFDTDSGSAAVDAVQRRVKGASRMNSKGKAHTPDESNCDKCGGKHAPRSCPAYGRDCNKCGRKNHYARCCFSKKTVQVVQGGDTTDSEEDGEAFFVGAVEDSESSKTDEWIADLGVNGATIPLKLDTGAQVNILTMKDDHRLYKKPKVHVKRVNLRTYND